MTDHDEALALLIYELGATVVSDHHRPTKARRLAAWRRPNPFWRRLILGRCPRCGELTPCGWIDHDGTEVREKPTACLDCCGKTPDPQEGGPGNQQAPGMAPGSKEDEMSVADAKAKLDEPKPEAFKFGEHGNEISGITVRLEMGETAYGKVPIIVIDTDGEAPGKVAGDTLRSVWLIHKALRGAVTKARPQPGDAIAIRCLGERESANGRTYTDYVCATDRDQSFSWDDDAKQAEVKPFDGDPWSDEPPF